MKSTRVFALMIIAVLIGAAALGTASDIDNCCFVDRQCSSDQQWIDGYWAFQNKQCTAPAQPAQSQPVASGPPPAQVDNCCYVDRQCGNDQQWIDGYWAFQNKQCAAPAQPAQSQPVASGPPPAQVDNCCYVDRQCSSDLDWIGGWHAYQNNLCGATTQAGAPSSSQQASGVILRTATGIVYGYNSGRSILPTTRPFLDPVTGLSNRGGSGGNCCALGWQCNNDQERAEGFRQYQTHFHCGAFPGLISIVGDPDFIDFYVQRLEELKNKLPHRYDYVLNGLNRIEQFRAFEGVGQVDLFLRSLDVSWEGPLVNGWEKRRSAVLVHEACHIHRKDAGYHASACDEEAWTREELFCREMELQVVIELDTEPDVTEWVRGMVERTRSGKAYPRPEGGFCD